MPTVMTQSRTYPIARPDAFERVLHEPLESIFSRRYGPIAAVRATEDAPDLWNEVGHTRTVRLADGSSMREELTYVDPPDGFGYTLTGFHGPLRFLVSTVDGEWGFATAGTGTRITWSWTVHPRSGVTAATLPALGVLWRGYARCAFQRIEDVLVTG